MNAERVLRRWDWHLPHVNLGGKSFRKCLSSIYRVDALSTFFSLDIKWLIYIYVSIWLFSIQTLSKGFCERTSVSPLISSEVHVDYQWWDFPVNLSHLSGENMMKFALRSICPLHSLMLWQSARSLLLSMRAHTHGRVKNRRFRSESSVPAFYHGWLNQTRFSVVKCCGKP